MIEFLVAVIAFVLVLSIIVTVHELGHFYFARKAGILCSDFSVGMGPVIYRKKKGETYYTIRALPIGGFVAMAGEDQVEDMITPGKNIGLQLEKNLVTEIILDSKIESEIIGEVVSCDLKGKDDNEIYIELNVNGEIRKYMLAEECYYVMPYNQRVAHAPYNRCVESKTVMQRFLTFFAGPVMNLILALVLFLIVGMANGVATNDNIIGSVTTNTAQLFLNEGDVITDIGGHPINSWSDIGEAMSSLKQIGDDYIYITVEGKDQPVEVLASIQINSIGITNIGTHENNHEGDGIVLGELSTANKAYEAGLRKFDVITSIQYGGNNYPINSWSDAMSLFDTIEKGNVVVTYIRDGEENKTKQIELFTDETLSKLETEKIMYHIGITPTTEFSFFGGIKNGFILTWKNATIIFSTLGMLFNPTAQVSVSDLSGPIGMFALVQTYLNAGFITFLSLIGMLSINFFVLNLLPFPALDGGRLAFLAYEGVTKKPVKKSVENTINTIGFVILMILMLYVTFNDLLRL